MLSGKNSAINMMLALEVSDDELTSAHVRFGL